MDQQQRRELDRYLTKPDPAGEYDGDDALEDDDDLEDPDDECITCGYPLASCECEDDDDTDDDDTDDDDDAGSF